MPVTARQRPGATGGERPGSGKSRLAEACRRHGVGLAYLFGSRAREGMRLLSDGQARILADDPLADLDLGIVTLDPLPDPAFRPALYIALYGDLEGFFEPLRVDLVFLEENHSVFQCEAIKGTCVYQVSERFRDDYEMRVLRRAADFRPVLRRFHREVLEEV